MAPRLRPRRTGPASEGEDAAEQQGTPAEETPADETPAEETPADETRRRRRARRGHGGGAGDAGGARRTPAPPGRAAPTHRRPAGAERRAGPGWAAAAAVRTAGAVRSVGAGRPAAAVVPAAAGPGRRERVGHRDGRRRTALRRTAARGRRGPHPQRRRVPGRATPERPPGRPGAPQRERTPIYDEVASAWFREAPPSAGPDEAEWASSSGDEGWRAAAATADALDAGVSAGGTTEAGLPKRRPRAQLVPGAARSGGAGTPGGAPDGAAAGPRRNADAIRGRLASYQRGVADGRTSRQARPADTGAERDARSGDEEEQ